jgi:hypothetical protein
VGVAIWVRAVPGLQLSQLWNAARACLSLACAGTRPAGGAGTSGRNHPHKREVPLERGCIRQRAIFRAPMPVAETSHFPSLTEPQLRGLQGCRALELGPHDHQWDTTRGQAGAMVLSLCSIRAGHPSSHKKTSLHTPGSSAKKRNSRNCARLSGPGPTL